MSARATQHAPNAGTPGEGRPTRRPDGAAAHSLRIGRLFGIPLQVHWSFPFLLALVVVAEWSSGTGAIVGGLVWVAALFACVVAHELAHCLLARRRGGTVLGILLLPIGGMSRMDRIPDRPADEAAIAAIGPATSLLLGGLLLSIGALIGSSVWPPTLLAGSWWARLGWLNLFLAAFNLVPALPMDGGRVLRAALAQRLPRMTATRVAASVARMLAVGMIVVGVLYDFDIWLVLIGIFVFLGASGEESTARAEQLAGRPPPRWGRWSGWYGPPGSGQGGWAPPQGGVGWYPPSGGSGPDGWYPPPPAGQGSGPWYPATGSGSGGWYPPPPPGPGPGPWPPPQPGQDPGATWWAATWWVPPQDLGGSSNPSWAAPDRRPSWAPPYGQQPSPRTRSPIDVAVERGRPDPGGGEPLGEGVGEHD